jgi:hypothetical protein
MRHLATFGLVVMALVHLPPLVGVLGAGKLAALYGIDVAGPDLQVLMRHRAVLFGILGAYQAYAVFSPAHRTAAFVAGIVSLAAFLAIVYSTPGHNANLAKVAMIDVVALVAGVAGFAAHLYSKP